MTAERFTAGRNDLIAEEVKEILTYYRTCDYNSVISKRGNGYHSLTFCPFISDVKNNTMKGYLHNKNLDVVYFSL